VTPAPVDDYKLAQTCNDFNPLLLLGDAEKGMDSIMLVAEP